MAKNHVERCSTSLIIAETHIRTTVRYHLTWVRMVIIEKSTNNECWRGCGEKGALLYCWWECKLVQPLWRIVCKLLKKLNRTTVWSSNPTPGHRSRENHNLKRYMYPKIHCSTIYNSPDMEPKCQLAEEWIKMWYIYTMEYYSVMKI